MISLVSSACSALRAAALVLAVLAASGCSATTPPATTTARAVAPEAGTNAQSVYCAEMVGCYDAAKALCHGPWYPTDLGEHGADKRYRLFFACGEDKPIDDRSGSLPPEGKSALASKLEHLHHAANVYMGVLIVPSLQGTTIEATASKAFNDRQLGDRGILVVVAIQEHGSRIETGHAIEHIVTDDDASRILRENLNPHLRRGDFVGGLTETADAIQVILGRQ